MAHEHGSLAAQHAGRAHRRRMLAALLLLAGFFVVEAVGGYLTGSLALLSDAGHMLTDVVGLGMALAAMQAATQGTRDPQRSFGLYRLEILAALLNAALLLGVAGWILFEAVRRLTAPPEVMGTPMLVVGVLGLLVNLVALWLLGEGSRESLNVEGARLEVLADTLGSIGVVVAAVLTQVTGQAGFDAAFAVAIGVFVVPRAFRLGRRALRILLQAAPPEIDVPGLEADLRALPGVADAHDVHVWTLTSGMEVASAHLRLCPGADGHDVLDRARARLREAHGIEHTTVQVEPASHEACDDCEQTACGPVGHEAPGASGTPSA